MFIVFYESKLEKGYNIQLASYVSIAYLLKLFDLLSFQLRSRIITTYINGAVDGVSQYGSWTSSISITWESIRNTYSYAPSQTN